MRTRSEAKRERTESKLREFQIDTPNDPINEQVVLAAMIADPGVRARLVKRFSPDAFYADPHKAIASGLALLEERKLDYDPAVVARLHPEVDIRVLETLAASRPDVPPNLDFHVDTLAWDWQRAQFTMGPLAAIVDAIQDPKASPERVRAIARQIGDAFGDADGGARFLRRTDDVVRDMMVALRTRAAGEAHYPYGIAGLDYDELGRRRLRPGAAPGLVTILTGMSGSGKALALDTPIPTPNGWTTMGEIAPDDIVFDERGERCNVVFCSTVMRDRECFEVEFSDGAKIVADAEHLWKTISYRERYMTYLRSDAHRESKRRHRGSKARRPSVSRTLEAHYEGRREELAVDGSVRTTRQIAETIMHGEHRNHAVVVAEPLVLPDAQLSIDPYVLGLWLGDGATDGAVFYTADRVLTRAFVDAGFIVRKGKSKDKYRFNVSGGFVTKLREAGVLGAKHIPMRYLRASIAQRIELLRGLMDTDGYCDTSGRLEFCSMNERLAHDVVELIRSLGVKARAAESDAVLDGRVVGRRWRVAFSTPFSPFHLSRKATRWNARSAPSAKRRYVVAARRVPSVPVRCIQVDSPSRLYIAGREMVPTHNTTMAAHLILNLARQRRRVLVGAWEVRAPMTLELVTTLSLRWSRSRVLDGKTNRPYDADGGAPAMTSAELDEFEARARAISKYVTFVDNPFRRGSVRAQGKVTNDDYLDLLEQHVEASGCDVALFDLFDRCLRYRRPDDEQEALWRLLEMTDRLQIHTIAVHQQLLKGDEVRADKKPSLAGLKGSSAYVDVAAAVLAPHLPARFKDVPDDTMEVYGLKQRFGAPFAIEFEWDPDTGQIAGGRDIPPEASSETSDDVFAPQKVKTRRRR